MTEPIKLPPDCPCDGECVTPIACGKGCRLALNLSPHSKAQFDDAVRTAIEQATADLRRERDEARAELARLATAAQKVIDRMQMDIDDGSRPDQWSMEDMVRTLRTPLSPVNEAMVEAGDSV
jgi:hypothetical protein